MSFDFLASKEFSLSNLSTMKIPCEGHFRHTSCELYWISTFLLKHAYICLAVCICISLMVQTEIKVNVQEVFL